MKANVSSNGQKVSENNEKNIEISSQFDDYSIENVDPDVDLIEKWAEETEQNIGNIDAMSEKSKKIAKKKALQHFFKPKLSPEKLESL